MNASMHRFSWLRDRPWVVSLSWIIPALLLPAVPIDETRYLSIAWEMHRSGDAIGLTLNGQPYMDKSPLLFWFINVAWMLVGVSTTSARCVCIAFASAAVATVTAIARRLGHHDPAVTGWMLLPFVVFGAFAPVAMFDVPLVYFVALGLLGLLVWTQGNVLQGVLVFLAACTLGLLAKGPVYLVHLAGPLILMRWWVPLRIARPWRLAAGILACIAVSCIPLAAWAIESAARIRDVPLIESLMHQSVGRVAHSFAHHRHVFWYLPWLLPFLLPWSFLARWRRVPEGVRRAMVTDTGQLGLCASVPALVVFSLISGKQIHYLLPILPGLALLFGSMTPHVPSVFAFHRVGWLLATVALAWAWSVANAIVDMHGNATWYIAALASAAVLTVGLVATRGIGERSGPSQLRCASFASTMALVSTVLLVGIHAKAHMDPQELADAVAALQRRGILVAAVDDEPGMITYLARLSRPLPRIDDELGWVAHHPKGFILMHASKGAPPSFVYAPVILADGWEGLVPAGRFTAVHP